MYNLKDILQSKGNAVWSVAPETIVFEALQLMAEKNIGALVVIDGGKLVGIFSERDYARKVALKGITSREAKVGDLMEREVYCMKPDTPIEECMHLMTEKRVRHVPVMEKGELAGIVTIGDIGKQIISEQEFKIQQLEHYICSG